MVAIAGDAVEELCAEVDAEHLVSSGKIETFDKSTTAGVNSISKFQVALKIDLNFHFFSMPGWAL